MNENIPTMDEWSQLYQAAIAVKEMSPWTWMSETDVFGIENPATGELAFVSVMGELGEHLSVAVYLGARGLYEFWRFHNMGPEGTFEDFARMEHLQASFEDRSELTDRDRQTIKALGLKFRGRQAWPQFRSYRPGYFPWTVEGHEARFLTLVLEQVQVMAARLQRDPDLLKPADEESYLVRVFRQGEWQDQVRQVPPPEPVTTPVPMNMQALKALKRAPDRASRLEVDLFLLPARIGEQGSRPSMAYTLLVVESGSGIVIGSDLLEAKASLEEMYGRVPMTLVEMLARIPIAPKVIAVRSEMLYSLLELLKPDLGFKLSLSPTLPYLDPAKAGLIAWMRR